MPGSPRRRSRSSPTPTIAEFEERHGRVPGSELLILGLGRLGGGALTFASDLDLIYLFSGTHEAESRRPEAAARHRLFQPARAAGHRRAVACRPRPVRSTKSTRGCAPTARDGLLAVSLESFERLSARAGLDLGAYGAAPRPPGLRLGGRRGPRLQRIIDETLRQPRDPARVDRRRGRDARARSPATSRRAGRSTSSLATGGLIDLEFAVQPLQLQPPHRPRSPPRRPRSPSLHAAGLVPGGARSRRCAC